MSLTASICLVFFICFFANAVQAAVGFGFVIICMALFPMFLPIGHCLVLAQFGAVLSGLWLLWGSFRSIPWRYVAFPVLFSSAGSLIGLLFLQGVSNDAYRKALGVLLVVLAFWMWKFSARVRIKASPLSGTVCGLSAGVMGAFFGVSVPPLVLYYSANMDSKESYMVPLQTTLMIQTAVCLAGRAGLGMWPVEVWPLLPAAALGLLLGKLPGRVVYERMDTARMKLLIYLFVGILGAYTFFSA